MPDIYTVTEDDILELYAWGDCLLMEKKNEAHNVVKFFEPLCMSCILEKTDRCGLSEPFVKGNKKSYAEAAGSTQSLHRLLAVWNKFKPPMLSEFFGLYRMWGHLIVDEIEGVTKCKWPLGRVVQKYPGVDGLSRTVQVKTIRGMVTRPVSRIHLLEAARED
uniref:DUF5641 domain-containing protein n=1 Tax=Trichuris muris TaxID=70415 RepID=A0A5S6QZN9_TRIMR